MLRGAVDLGHDLQVVRGAADPFSSPPSASWLEVLRHESLALEERVEKNNGVVIVVRRVRPHLDGLTMNGAEDQILLRVHLLPGRFFSMRAGPNLDVAIYVTIAHGKIIISWQLEDLRPFLSRRAVDARRAGRYVAGFDRYESRLIFDNVHRLTERSELRIGPDLQVSEFLPVAAESLNTRSLAPEINPGSAALAAMVSALRTLRQFESLTFELSGGYDSSCLVIAAARANLQKFNTYGIEFSGDAGTFQRRRREAVLAVAGAEDQTLNVLESRFLDHWLKSGAWIDPYEDIYAPMMQAMLSVMPILNGRSVVVTGIGGDEAFLPVRGQVAAGEDIRDTISLARPKSRRPESSLMAANSRGAMFLRNGVWPENAYLNLHLVEFSEQLAEHLKDGRGVQRAILLESGLDPGTFARPHPENFEIALRRELQRVLEQSAPLNSRHAVATGAVDSATYTEVMATDPMTCETAELSRFVRLSLLERCLNGLSN